MSEEPFPQQGSRTTTGQDAETDREDGGGQPEQSEGQVSEVQRLDGGDADTPISPEDATAGYPESEAGMPDTQGSGPDAAPPANRRDDEHARRGHKHPGQGIDRG